MNFLDTKTATDEKKPLNSLEDTRYDDAQPDPDEILSLPFESTSGRIWLIKLPKFLMKRWLAVETGDQLLGTLRVWNERDRRTEKQFMSLFVPSEKDPSVLEEFKLDMVQEKVRNQYVIASTDKDPKNPTNRAKSTIMSGRVKHEVNVRPTYNADYSSRMRARVAAASKPVRQIKMIEESMGGERGNINMLSSGINQRTSSFDSLVIRILLFAIVSFLLTRIISQRTSKGRPGQNTERFIRMPKNQLLDQLFQLFNEKQYWSVKELRLRTEQPETYLKEVLPQIAMQHKSGSQNGLWELMKNYKEPDKEKHDIKGDDSTMMNLDTDEDFDDDEMEEIQ
ncbi:hypothetical protein Clacol_002376 [Clathrus columnatus]|uniref:Transcription initiation factor IIF subunit beta n=1 Tax=Clathrus columnatus TaxID=1419009 RepID=A0AAV5A4P2_9AGAM|nr:hypothetical protein Clacol_002376 [Clathrus columnatus]